jgi:glucan phosphoethanolaminetransferase (alkaline phosphatase superfamily)
MTSRIRKNTIIQVLGFITMSWLLPWQALAYIDPGTTGSVVGGLGGMIWFGLTFLGGLFVAIIIKIKKLWLKSVWGKVLIILLALIVIGIITFLFYYGL